MPFWPGLRSGKGAPLRGRLRRPCLRSRPSSGTRRLRCRRLRPFSPGDKNPCTARDPRAWSVIVKLDNAPKLYYSGTHQARSGDAPQKKEMKRDGRNDDVHCGNDDGCEY